MTAMTAASSSGFDRRRPGGAAPGCIGFGLRPDALTIACAICPLSSSIRAPALVSFRSVDADGPDRGEVCFGDQQIEPVERALEIGAMNGRIAAKAQIDRFRPVTL